MGTILWGGAVLLSLAGALLFWGAHLFSVESFYGDASLLMLIALLLAGLSRV